MYTGKVHIEQINVQELLAAADMLQIPEVVSECCDFLCRELHPSNALGILRFAEAHHCEELAQSAQNYVFTNFPQVHIGICYKFMEYSFSDELHFQVAQEDELLDTPQTLLSRILTSELLRVDSETQVKINLSLNSMFYIIKHPNFFLFHLIT